METNVKEEVGSTWNFIKEEYEIIESIGKGKFGEVKKVKHLSTGLKLAIKRIDLSAIWNTYGFRSVIREIHILRKLSKSKGNKFTVKLLDVLMP